MRMSVKTSVRVAVGLSLLGWVGARAGLLEDLGVTLLRQADPALNGSNGVVAQVEAPMSGGSPPPYQVNPTNWYVGLPGLRFVYTSDLGSATNFPNAVGTESSHANSVGGNFFGLVSGVATGVAQVVNYEAGHFFNQIIAKPVPPAISARIVNQSFIFAPEESTNVNRAYDNYVADHGTLFVSGVGNGGGTPVSAPGTCYNGIGVGAYLGSTSFGPTSDGRCKPDLVGPGGATSFSAPFVAGIAAVLRQGAERGDGGPDVSAATDARTLKALLLNSALKPTDWTNGPATPLDARHGAGNVHALGAWNQLRGGKQAFIEATSNPAGGAHPPGANPTNLPVRTGWDFNTITTSGSNERVHHYYLRLPAGEAATWTFTATLVWQRQKNKTSINNLNLYLYHVATSNLVACSTSLVDNVEHLHVPSLPAGRYDLQVWKTAAGQVSNGETYALAFDALPPPRLQATPAGSSVALTWPLSAVGFTVQAATNLTPTVSWTTVNAPVAISNQQHYLALPAVGEARFFRLRRP